MAKTIHNSRIPSPSTENFPKKRPRKFVGLAAGGAAFVICRANKNPLRASRKGRSQGKIWHRREQVQHSFLIRKDKFQKRHSFAPAGKGWALTGAAPGGRCSSNPGGQ